MNLKKLAAAIGATALLVAGAVIGIATPANAHIASVRGVASCTGDGTYTVTWTYNATAVPKGAQSDVEVAAHAPEPSTLDADGVGLSAPVDGVLWINATTAHVDSNDQSGIPTTAGDFSRTFTQAGIAGSATSANVAVQVAWSDGYKVVQAGSVVLAGTCGQQQPAQPQTVVTCTSVQVSSALSGVDVTVTDLSDKTSSVLHLTGNGTYTLPAASLPSHYSITKVQYNVPKSGSSGRTKTDTITWTGALTCGDNPIASATPVLSAATCQSQSTITLPAGSLVHSTLDDKTPLDLTVGTHTVTFDADAGYAFADGSTTKDYSYTITARLAANSQTCEPYLTVVWQMPDDAKHHPAEPTTTTWPQQYVASYPQTQVAGALDVDVPTTCGTAYQIDVYNNDATTARLIANGTGSILSGPSNPTESFPPGNRHGSDWGYLYKLVVNPDCAPLSGDVTFTDTVCSNDQPVGNSETVTLGAGTTATYRIGKGQVQTLAAGTYSDAALVAGQLYTIVLTAENGSTKTFTHTFGADLTDADCNPTTVVASAVTYVDNSCSKESTLTVPAEPAGVILTLDGDTAHPLAAGEVTLAVGDHTVVATAAHGYALASGAHSWSFTVSAMPDCDIPVADAPPVFTDNSCTTSPTGNAQLTITETVGIDWFVNGVQTAAGTHPVAAGSTITVSEQAEPGYTITDNPSSWTFTAGPVENFQSADSEASCYLAPATLTGSLVTGECIANAPWIFFDVVVDNPNHLALSGHDVTISMNDGKGDTWTQTLGTISTATEGASATADSLTLSGKILWPGASVAADGVTPTGWPGWTQDASGNWVETTGNYAWTRTITSALVEVNPLLSVAISYPPATPSCNAAPPTDAKPAADASGLADTGSNVVFGVVTGVVVIVLGGLVLAYTLIRRRRTTGEE